MASLPWLILPTFNEAENLEAIVDAAGPALAAASPEGYRILVVDDSSPDGTGEIADRLAAQREEVEVLHRPVREARRTSPDSSTPWSGTPPAAWRWTATSPTTRPT
jgi:Glycosyl transferase family 2